jgi:hypothetical protein
MPLFKALFWALVIFKVVDCTDLTPNRLDKEQLSKNRWSIIILKISTKKGLKSEPKIRP